MSDPREQWAAKLARHNEALERRMFSPGPPGPDELSADDIRAMNHGLAILDGLEPKDGETWQDIDREVGLTMLGISGDRSTR